MTQAISPDCCSTPGVSNSLSGGDVEMKKVPAVGDRADRLECGRVLD